MSSLAPIVNWSPTHEYVVSLHIMGNSNKRIATAVGLSEVRVSQILHDPEAQKLIHRAKLSMRQKMSEDIEGRLVVAAEASVGRIEETLDAEFIPGSDGKKHQDGVALSILKGTGFLSKDFSGEGEAKRPPISSSQAERLISAMEKANEARQLAHEQEILEAEIVEDD